MNGTKRNEPAATGPFQRKEGMNVTEVSNSADIHIIAQNGDHVKYEDIPKTEIVAAVRNLYPGFDKTLLSKCEHGYKYGIQLRKDAEKLILQTFAPDAQKRRRKDAHKRVNRISARVSSDVYSVLQQAIQRRNCTMQDLIEELVLNFIKGGNTHGNIV